MTQTQLDEWKKVLNDENMKFDLCKSMQKPDPKPKSKAQNKKKIKKRW